MSQVVILDSRGRAITSTDGALDVNIKNGALPVTVEVDEAGLATSDKQDEQTTALADINTNLEALLTEAASTTAAVTAIDADAQLEELQAIRRLLEAQQLTIDSTERAGVH